MEVLFQRAHVRQRDRPQQRKRIPNAGIRIGPYRRGFGQRNRRRGAGRGGSVHRFGCDHIIRIGGIELRAEQGRGRRTGRHDGEHVHHRPVTLLFFT